MSEKGISADHLFMQLVLSLQMGAVQQMGKIASPITGKVERDLIMAKASIDMLGMLETKTKGNLTEEEQKLISHVLYELRLNYVEETKKKDQKEETSEEPKPESEPESHDPDEKSESTDQPTSKSAEKEEK